MKMNMKWTIILGILLVLVASYIGLMGLENDTDHLDEWIELFSTDKDSIVEISLDNNKEAFTFIKEEGIWYFKDQPTVKLIQIKVDGLAYDLSSIIAKRRVEENAKNLSQYGLEQPEATIHIRFNDGSEQTFYVGYNVPTVAEYYFKLSTDNSVYTLDSGKGQLFVARMDDFKDKNIISFPQDQIVRLRVLDSDKEMYSVEKREDNLNPWFMTYPYHWEVDTQKLQQLVLSRITYMDADRYVTDKSIEEMGLEPPQCVIELTLSDQNTYRILAASKEGEFFVKCEGFDTAAAVSVDLTALLKIEPFDLLNSFITVIDIEKIKSFEININGKKTAYYIDKQGNERTYRVNSKTITENEFKNIYAQFMSLKIIELSDKIPTAKSGMSYQVVMEDNTIREIQFLVYDERNYAVTLDNKAYFNIRKADFEMWRDQLGEMTKQSVR